MIDLLLKYNPHEYIITCLLLFTRIFASLSASTLFSKQILPSIARASISLVFALTYGMYFYNDNFSNLSGLFLVILIFKEIVCGYLLGVLISLPFMLVQSCGNIIDGQRGAQISSTIDPLTNTTSPIASKLLLQIFIMYFVCLNGLTLVLNIIFKSLTIVKINELIPVSLIYDYQKYIDFFSTYTTDSVLFVFPIVIVTILIDLVLGIIGSFIPQLNVTIFSFAIKGIVVFLILICILHIILGQSFMILNLFRIS